ncbi:hypothetical protein B0H16DRAFT_1561134 [Mycena metata]|uniref:Uncharacterized protein n=1 Tax=Mycena metata TaxID=1033252 RepID=A0AAD7IJH0_9AGAR|nr:hypothetical protein B0H16DRAFT_1561134 [Mycena metata]
MSNVPESDTTSLTPKEPKVKVTLWRLLNTAILLMLGIWKAAATYKGQITAPTTLDWIIGVLWALISYWLGIIEQENPACVPWLFERDSSHDLRVVLLWLLPASAIFLAFTGVWATLMALKPPRTALSTILLGPLGCVVVGAPALLVLSLSPKIMRGIRGIRAALLSWDLSSVRRWATSWPPAFSTLDLSIICSIWMALVAFYVFGTRPSGLDDAPSELLDLWYAMSYVFIQYLALLIPVSVVFVFTRTAYRTFQGETIS